MGAIRGVRTAALMGIVCVLALAGAAGSPMTARTIEAAPARVAGDADCSGGVSAADAPVTLRVTAEVGESSCPNLADADCNGAVDGADTLRILRFLAGVANNPVHGCSAVGAAYVTPQSSNQLIDAALAGGQIDDETALQYEVFASFGDSRLPSEYEGVPGKSGDALRRAGATYGTLSQGTKDALAPFLLPPSAPGSWVELGTSQPAAAPQGEEVTWTVVTVEMTNPARTVKVWSEDRYPGDDAKAQAMAGALSGKIWGMLSGLFGAGHMPLPDGGLPNNGGGDEFDIYLAHIGDQGQFVESSEGNSCQQYPGYILLNSDYPIGSETSPGMIQTLAHELTHAIQATFSFSTGCWYPEYAWAEEGSATWAEDFVYPKAQSEHTWAEFLIDHPAVSLDQYDGDHQYGVYVWFFYLARTGSPDAIPLMWLSFKNSASLAALEDVLPGDDGLERAFQKFANYNWNKAPVQFYYDLDKLWDSAPTIIQDPTTVGLDEAEAVPVDLPYLSANYANFDFEEDVKKVTFKNTFAKEEIEHAKVWAIVKANGEWKDPEDISGEQEKIWCRNDETGSEKIDQLVLVFSNTDWQGKATVEPEHDPSLKGEALGCNGWKGTMKATVMWDLNFGARSYGSSITTFNGIWQSDSPILDGYKSWCHPSTEDPCYPYLTQGTITWSWDAHWASDPPCNAHTEGVSAAGVYTIPSDQMIFLEPDGPDHFRYWGYGGWIGPGPQDCPAEVGSGSGPPIFFDLPYNEVPASAALPAGSQQTYCYELGWRIEETADHISGSCYGGYYRYDGSDGYNHNSLFYEWDLHKVGDPFARP